MKKKMTTGLSVLASAALVGAGLLVAPAAHAVGEEDTASDVIGGEVKSVIAIETSGDVNISVLPDAGGRISSSSHDVVVSTTSADGYTLQVKSASPNPRMADVNDPAVGFAAVSGTQAAPVDLADDSWGFRVGPMDMIKNAPSTNLKFAGMTTADQQLKSASAAVMGDVTKVNYAIKAKTLGAGLYTNEVLYTATAQ